MLIRAHAVVDFYNQINLLYGAITEFCSPQTCPEMKATDEYEIGPGSDARAMKSVRLTQGTQVRVLMAGQ
jgi:Mob1/phocein family